MDSMNGTNANTGAALSSNAHLTQSIGDILNTPLGTRVLRRDYGSNLLELIDAPINNATKLQLYSAVAGALEKWEPRLRLTRAQLSDLQADPGTPSITASSLPLADTDDYIISTETGYPIGVAVLTPAPGNTTGVGITLQLDGENLETGDAFSADIALASTVLN